VRSDNQKPKCDQHYNMYDVDNWIFVFCLCMCIVYVYCVNVYSMGILYFSIFSIFSSYMLYVNLLFHLKNSQTFLSTTLNSDMNREESPSCLKTNCSKTSCLKTEYQGAERIEPWWAWCIILPTSNPILKSQNFFFPFLMPSGNFIITEFHTKNYIIVFSDKNTYFWIFFSNSLLIINYYNLKSKPF